TRNAWLLAENRVVIHKARIDKFIEGVIVLHIDFVDIARHDGPVFIQRTRLWLCRNLLAKGHQIGLAVVFNDLAVLDAEESFRRPGDAAATGRNTHKGASQVLSAPGDARRYPVAILNHVLNREMHVRESTTKHLRNLCNLIKDAALVG